MRAFDRDPIREGHYGQRPCKPHSKAGHMAASTNAAAATILDNPEPFSNRCPGCKRNLSWSTCFFCSTAPQAFFRPDRNAQMPARADVVKAGRACAATVKAWP
jgi:hypothetical protein